MTWGAKLGTSGRRRSSSRRPISSRAVVSLNWFGEAGNEETRLWLKTASADFSNSLFEEGTGFEGFIFPGPIILANAVFQLPVSFAAAEFMLNANFAHAHFHGDVNFECAKFAGQAVFDDAAFDGLADFERTEFLKEEGRPARPRCEVPADAVRGQSRFPGLDICRKRRFFEGPVCRHRPLRRGPLHRRRRARGRGLLGARRLNACKFLEKATFRGPAVHRRGALRRGAVQWRMRHGAQPILGRRFLPRRHLREKRDLDAMRVEGASGSGHQILRPGRFPRKPLRGAGRFFWARPSRGPRVFRLTQFKEGGSWTGCEFADNADFSYVALTENSSFKDSRFLSEATFKEAHFEAPVFPSPIPASTQAPISPRPRARSPSCWRAPRRERAGLSRSELPRAAARGPHAGGGSAQALP